VQLQQQALSETVAPKSRPPPPGGSGAPCRTALASLGVTDEGDTEPIDRGDAAGAHQKELSLAAAKRPRSAGGSPDGSPEP
jgi:hypothetical protein